MLNNNGVKTKWFQAAAIVTGGNALGAADEFSASLHGLNAWYLHDYSEPYLRDANEYLFVWNYANFLVLDDGKDIPGLEGKRGKDLDYGLVGFEQQKVEDFSAQYFLGKDPTLKGKILADITSAFRAPKAPPEVNDVMERKFKSQGKDFNFGSKEDRITLGNGIIDILYERDK